ncbi:unnamed protein product [Linum trigynum]|uniref:DUF1995 domain-containing protein n=1 Tax=Linum trigynum TaxID=586398 RepID=A0AAV2F7N1_9ROSI
MRDQKPMQDAILHREMRKNLDSERARAGEGTQRVKAICPDAGAAALLNHGFHFTMHIEDVEANFVTQDEWFPIIRLGDRKPVDSEDEVVVMLVPDYQMVSSVEKITASLSDDLPRQLIMWNSCLISEDVGVGINVRNLRRYFSNTLNTVTTARRCCLQVLSTIVECVF